MTIINPTPIIKPATVARIEGMSEHAQLRRLSLLAGDVARRFAPASDDGTATAYVFQGEDFDPTQNADAAAYVVARVLSYIASTVAGSDLADACLDGSEPKQFRKGYEAGLDQIGTELLNAISYAL